MNIKVIAFDADDTLWINEPFFQETEKKFYDLMEDYLPAHSLAKELFKIEIDNLDVYGYGIKAYILSMIEAALHISENTIRVEAIGKIIEYGKEMLEKPVELIDGVEEVLKVLYGKYKTCSGYKGRFERPASQTARFRLRALLSPYRSNVRQTKNRL